MNHIVIESHANETISLKCHKCGNGICFGTDENRPNVVVKWLVRHSKCED